MAASADRTCGSPAPSAAWIDAFRPTARCAPEHRDTMRAHAGGDRRSGGLRLRRGRGPTDGHGDRRVDGDHMGLFDVLVMPQARRRGLARRSPRASMPGHGRHGARFAYLQVVATNEAAMPLYAAQGFRIRVRSQLYAYRVPSIVRKGRNTKMANYPLGKELSARREVGARSSQEDAPSDLRGELRAVRRPAVHRLPRQGDDLPRLQGSVGQGGRRLPEARRQSPASMSGSTCPTRRTTSSPSSACSRPAAGW